ncbi:unnamed protein product, partial [Heterosigma akashiwo]
GGPSFGHSHNRVSDGFGEDGTPELERSPGGVAFTLEAAALLPPALFLRLLRYAGLHAGAAAVPAARLAQTALPLLLGYLRARGCLRPPFPGAPESLVAQSGEERVTGQGGGGGLTA